MRILVIFKWSVWNSNIFQLILSAGLLNEAQSCSWTWSWITMRNRFLSGATIISCLLLRTLKKVRSFKGSISLTTLLAFLANSVTFYAYYLGAVSLLLDIVDLRNLPFSSTMSRPRTPLWFLIRAILSSTSAIWC